MTVYPDDTKIWGPDVSFYQDDDNTARGIDFNKMKEQGADFVFIRAGQRSWFDPDFRLNWEAAKDAGLLRSAYWFLDARSSGGAQAALMKSLLDTEGWGELPPVVDYEHKVRELEKISKTRTRSVWRYNNPIQLDDFIDTLKYPGNPIIYTGYYYWTYYGSPDPKYAQYPLWIARYEAIEPLIPKPWTDWTFWQFSDRGPGLVLGAESSRIDLNYFKEDRKKLFALTGQVDPSPPAPENKPCDCDCPACGDCSYK